MKKCICYIMFFLLLCSCAKKVDNNETIPDITVGNIYEINEIESDNANNEESAINSDKFYSDNREINDFLNNKNIEDNLANIEFPAAKSDIVNELIDPTVIMDHDIELITDGDFSTLETRMPVVPSNRIAILATMLPYFDNSTQPTSIHVAEQFLDCDISWARTTGILSSGDNAERMYTIMKAETGGYVYVFFDKLQESYRLKFILYVERMYDSSEFINIQIGDSMEKLAEIDMSCALFYNNFEDSYYMKKFYYVKDDVLCIDFDETKRISNIEYIGYEFPNFMNNLVYDNSRAYDISILQQDYPPES